MPEYMFWILNLCYRIIMSQNSDIKEILICISDCCLTPTAQYFSYIMLGTSCISWDDNDDDRSVLDQHAFLDFYSASSLK